DLFGGQAVICGATRTSQITLDAARIDRNSVRHTERAFALLVQALTNPERAERISGITGSTLTAGRLMATLDHPKKLALARLLLAFPTHPAKGAA
ncbi:hypothetical protein GUH33_09365, partial [Xanthomonas citri pv. citri]|nr:hypothetical protein [Xanthomonas citri pv. citri]